MQNTSAGLQLKKGEFNLKSFPVRFVNLSKDPFPHLSFSVSPKGLKGNIQIYRWVEDRAMVPMVVPLLRKGGAGVREVLLHRILPFGCLLREQVEITAVYLALNMN